MKIAKKLLVCGLSLALISSVGVQGVSAHHVHVHRHYRISRVMKRHHRKYRHRTMKLNSAKQGHYLSFKQLIKAMNYDTDINHNHKYHSIIMKTLYHNKGQYTTNQLNQILTNKDTNMWEGYPFSPKLYEALVNQVFTRTDYVKLESNQGSSFTNSMRTNLIKDINKSRIENGVKPLKVTNIMQNVANYRDPYAQYEYDHINDYLNYSHDTSNPTDNWVHGVDTHHDAGGYLKAHGLGNHTISSNVGNWRANNLGKNPDGTDFSIDNTTPYGVAYNINNMAINHDNVQGNNNSHRMNELNPQMKYLGVGVSYDPNTNIGTYNEQFSY